MEYKGCYRLTCEKTQLEIKDSKKQAEVCSNFRLNELEMEKQLRAKSWRQY